MKDMAVSSGDRSFMRRIGRYKAASHGAAAARHLALPVTDRLQRSWDLYLTYRSSQTIGTRRDDPSPFYERARRLGIYSSRT
ncbi:hypothetical protein LCGC14_1831130 [marine sediment metagenome]|uniref:Uncharacterized protein n=1 Tax=marine sediment metagenome TaxID=412755 RepID=A0A0F9GGD2_9ZZZZ